MGRLLATVGRGAALGAASGGVLGGLVGTAAWPFVGTVIGGVLGALAGAPIGIVDGLVLAYLARATSSRWVARATSGTIAAYGAAVTVTVYLGPDDAPAPVAAAFITIATLVGALFGPPIAFGMEQVPGRGLPREVVRRLRRFLVWGAVVGTGLGAVTGLIIGIRTYLPTAAFAAVEGAGFGVVSGPILACAAAAASVLPRMCARR